MLDKTDTPINEKIVVLVIKLIKVFKYAYAIKMFVKHLEFPQRWSVLNQEVPKHDVLHKYWSISFPNWQ